MVPLATVDRAPGETPTSVGHAGPPSLLPTNEGAGTRPTWQPAQHMSMHPSSMGPPMTATPAISLLHALLPGPIPVEPSPVCAFPSRHSTPASAHTRARGHPDTKKAHAAQHHQDASATRLPALTSRHAPKRSPINQPQPQPAPQTIPTRRTPQLGTFGSGLTGGRSDPHSLTPTKHLHTGSSARVCTITTAMQRAYPRIPLGSRQEPPQPRPPPPTVSLATATVEAAN